MKSHERVVFQPDVDSEGGSEEHDEDVGHGPPLKDKPQPEDGEVVRWADIVGIPEDLGEGEVETIITERGTAVYQIAATVGASPTANLLMVQIPFHDPFSFNEAILYADTAPASDYSVTATIGGVDVTLTLPAGNNITLLSLNEIVNSEEVLRVVTQGSTDSSIQDFTVSFDLSRR